MRRVSAAFFSPAVRRDAGATNARISIVHSARRANHDADCGSPSAPAAFGGAIGNSVHGLRWRRNCGLRLPAIPPPSAGFDRQGRSRGRTEVDGSPTCRAWTGPSPLPTNGTCGARIEVPVGFGIPLRYAPAWNRKVFSLDPLSFFQCPSSIAHSPAPVPSLRASHTSSWLDLCPKPASPRSAYAAMAAGRVSSPDAAFRRCKAARRVIPRETTNPPVRHPPLRCGPAGAAPIASGMSIAIEAAMVAGS